MVMRAELYLLKITNSPRHRCTTPLTDVQVGHGKEWNDEAREIPPDIGIPRKGKVTKVRNIFVADRCTGRMLT